MEAVHASRADRNSSPSSTCIFFYTNQFIAATNTFVCITVCRRATAICTSLPIQNQLSLSQQGQESILDQLNRYYYRIVNFLSSAANMIDLSSDLYLSNQIAGAIASATILTRILLTLPVMGVNVSTRAQLQGQLALALANLQALGAVVK